MHHVPPEGVPLQSTAGLLPQSRRLAVEPEEAGQSTIALIGTGGAVLLGVLGERIQQAPAGRISEFFMTRLFELPEDRYHIARIDRSGLGRFDDGGTGNIILDVLNLQVFDHGFERQEIIFECVDGFHDQAVQLNP